MNFTMATLGSKEMEKFLWEGREKGLPCWLSQFSKTGIMKSGFEAMPLLLLDDKSKLIKLFWLHCGRSCTHLLSSFH